MLLKDNALYIKAVKLLLLKKKENYDLAMSSLQDMLPKKLFNLVKTALVDTTRDEKALINTDITIESVKSLNLLEPFGEANKTPIFIYKNLKIDSIRALSEGKHLKLTLKDGNTIINAIGFNMGAYSEEYLIGDKIDVVGILEINSYNGIEGVQINMKDLRKSY